MSRRRKGSETNASAPRPSPSIRVSLRNAVIKLNQEADLDIPYKAYVHQTPKTLIQHQIFDCCAEISSRDNVVLEQAISKFLNGIQSLTSVESRYRRLLAILESFQSDSSQMAHGDRQPSPEQEDEQFQNMARLEPGGTSPSIKAFFKNSKLGGSSSNGLRSSKDIQANRGPEALLPNSLLAPPGVPRQPIFAPIFSKQIQRLYTAGLSQPAHDGTRTTNPAEPSAVSTETPGPPRNLQPVDEDILNPDLSNAALEDPNTKSPTDETLPSPTTSEVDAYLAMCLETEDTHKSTSAQTVALQEPETDASNGALNLACQGDSAVSTSPDFKPLVEGETPKISNIWTVLATNSSILSCVPVPLQGSPFELQSEVQRILQRNFISSDDLLRELSDRTLPSLYAVTDKLELPFRQGFHLNAKGEPDLDYLTLEAELHWMESSTDSFFKIKALPPKKQKSSALQRRFGQSRILVVSLVFPDDMNSKPKLTYLREWFSRPQCFFGRTWSFYSVRPKEKKDTSRRHSGTVFKAVLFADSSDTSIVDVVNWALPISENGDQAARKAYTRLELQSSRTVALTTLEASDIDFSVPSILANGEAEDDQFLDPKLAQDYSEPAEQSPRDMSDGCACISDELLLRYQRLCGLQEPPSVLQGRIAGAKGMWVRAPKIPGPSPVIKQIQVCESQVKVNRKTLVGTDSSVRTLNIVHHNGPARPAPLYIHFIPILEDRGVPKDAILAIARAQIQREGEKYLDALRSKETLALRGWLASYGGRHEAVQRDFGVRTLAGFPTSKEEKIIQMLETGFDHRANHYLSHLVREIGRKYFERWTKQSKIGLPQATSLRGVTDRMGILGPGEIHVTFSRRFEDAGGATWRSLDGIDALVARNPAMAPWDVQKVRVVFYPELQELTDVVVFSTRGKRPLAEKTQGGDYDGDTFWVCWEPTLVEPFENAPAPWNVPAPEEFGIVTDKSKLSEHITDPTSQEQCRQWLGKMATARMEPTFLGQATNLHERVIYHQGRIDTPEAIALVHLHGYLVDADKQGFSFSKADFERFKERHGIKRFLPDPLYKEFVEAEDKKDVLERRQVKTVVDELFVDVIVPEIEKVLKEADGVLLPSRKMDEDLSRFYRNTISSSPPRSTISDQVSKLKGQILELKVKWSAAWLSWSGEKSESDEIIMGLRKQYETIQPDLSKVTMKQWTLKQGHDMSVWDKLKASAFAEFAWDTRTTGALVFGVAGSEMCRIKAHEVGPSRVMSLDYYCAQKFRMPKSFNTIASDESDGEDDLG